MVAVYCQNKSHGVCAWLDRVQQVLHAVMPACNQPPVLQQAELLLRTTTDF
jgi:hypothetical protein